MGYGALNRFLWLLICSINQRSVRRLYQRSGEEYRAVWQREESEGRGAAEVEMSRERRGGERSQKERGARG